MGISQRRHDRGVVINRRRKQARWANKVEPGRWSKKSPFGCSKPNCIHCQYAQWYHNEMRKAKEDTDKRTLLNEYGSIVNW